MVRNNKNINFFNMIEVALAMAVIAFGMTSILGLFPVGLNACRNAIADNSASDAAGQFSSYLKGYAESSKANFENLFGTSATTGYYNTVTNPMIPATVTAVKSQTEDFLKAISTGVPYAAVPIYNGWTIFPSDNTASPTYKNIYYTVFGPGNYFDTTGAAKFPNWDFAALIVVWKSPIKSYVPNSTGTAWIVDEDVGYERGAAVNIEVSWPLDVDDYNARQKRTFYIEINKPQ